MLCPFCKKRIKPVVFSLWPEAAVKLCPKCRIGLKVLVKEAQVLEGRKKKGK